MKLFPLALAFELAIYPVFSEHPNIVIMLADDAGYSDFGCFGGQAKTPNIDQLAEEGMRFTDLHAAAPNCSPSRSGLLTGRYPSRVGVFSYLPQPENGVPHPMHLPDSEITLAEILRDKGYQTAHFGKWHLSGYGTDQPQPLEQGFDYSFGTSSNARPSHLNPDNFHRNGKPLGVIEGYACQILVDDAIQWLESKRGDDPFFLYVAFQEPHTPIASPPEMVAQYNFDEKRNEYLANNQNLDDAAGRLVDKLDELGLGEDTIVMFTSDNGSLHDASNGGFRGQKSMVFEGGIREPAVIRWPGRIKAGAVCDATLNFVDMVPTICSIMGIPFPKDRTIDGVDFSPALFGESWSRDKPLLWYFYRSIAGSGQRVQGVTQQMPAGAFRKGDWVLLGYLRHSEMPSTHAMVASDMDFIRESTWDRFELYNLRTDIAQERNVANENRDLVDRLSREMTAVHRDMIAEAPYWEWPDVE